MQTEDTLRTGASFAGPEVDGNKGTADAVDEGSSGEGELEKLSIEEGERCIGGEEVGCRCNAGAVI